jgi:branched-chain amino acid aminotransferase
VKLALVGAVSSREAIDPAAKTGSHLSNVLAMQHARALGAYEALRLDREGRITEAASANVFVVRGSELLTPPLASGILEGVTRRRVLEIAREEGIAVREAELWPGEFIAADEAFITSTTRELVPVVAVFEGEVERRIGAGVPGPTTLRLLAAFRERAWRGER